MLLDHKDRLDKVYLVLTTLFCVLLILSNMIGEKILKAPFSENLALTSGILTYPITFVITDIVSEIWGEKKAKFMVYLAFAMNVVMLFFVQLILYLPAHASWFIAANPFGYESTADYQNAFSCVFFINDKILIGSMLAFLSAQLLDIRIFSRLKKATSGKKLWLRNNVSTCVSQLFDTLIVNVFVLFWGLHFDFFPAMNIMLGEYLYKVIFALCDTPFVYLGIYLIKRYRLSYERKQAA